MTRSWRTEYVDLHQFVGQWIYVIFAAVNDYGNSIFLDNINLIEYNFETPDATFSITADSICRNDTLYFEAVSPLSGVNSYLEFRVRRRAHHRYRRRPSYRALPAFRQQNATADCRKSPGRRYCLFSGVCQTASDCKFHLPAQ